LLSALHSRLLSHLVCLPKPISEHLSDSTLSTVYLIDNYFKQFRLSNNLVLDICAINHEQNCICAGIIRCPYSPHSLLSSQIPCTKLHVIVFNFLDVAADSRGSFDCFS
jgi:hypothetical protein